MAEIEIDTLDDETYQVVVREAGQATEHRVTVTEEHRKRYGGGASAEDLLEESFRFLLEREPKEAILASFELPVIERYFPEYPDRIGRRLGG